MMPGLPRLSVLALGCSLLVCLLLWHLWRDADRRADEAERETDKLKKCEYMAKFVGQSFDGVISGVTNWGLYVELPNTVEGLVRIGELRDDYYIFDERSYQLTGEMTKRTYKLGQPIRILVAGADKLTRTVDFVLDTDSGKRERSDR